MTSTIVFDHRGRTQKGRPGPLEVRITHQRKVYYVSTGVKVLKSQWRCGEVVGCPDADEKMDQLEAVQKAVSDEVAECLRTNRPIDVAEIRRSVWLCAALGKTPQTPFLDWYEEQYMSYNIAQGTRAHYKTTLARLRECNLFNRWSDLTVENVLQFDSYLHALKKPASYLEKKKGCPTGLLSNGAVYNHHKCLKAMIARAVACGKVASNPYEQLKGKFDRGDRETVSFLTEEEMTAFCELTPPRGSLQAAAKDLFIFQLYTGMSYCDTQCFDIADYKEVKGHLVHIGTRVKTGVPYVSQLLPPAVEVLKRYGMATPKMPNQVYNVQLKALGTAAGITTPLHSHMARHTFATWMLRNGVKIENVSRMLGHTNVVQTQRYAKVLAESVCEDFAKVAEMLAKRRNKPQNHLKYEEKLYLDCGNRERADRLRGSGTGSER